jgi:hypothetical protein
VAAAQGCPNCRPVRPCYLVSWRSGNRIDWISSARRWATAAVSVHAAWRRPGAGHEMIPIVTTATRFGGVRHWFACPSCRRRCRIVYGGPNFRCRVCRRARYESQYEHPALRICSRRWRIRRKLQERGGPRCPWGLDDGFPPKPSRMHLRTYRRLQALDQRLAGRWSIGITDLLEKMDRRMRRA